MNMISSELAAKIIKHNVTIAMYCLKSQTTSHSDLMYVFLGYYVFANTAPVKIAIKHPC